MRAPDVANYKSDNYLPLSMMVELIGHCLPSPIIHSTERESLLQIMNLHYNTDRFLATRKTHPKLDILNCDLKSNGIKFLIISSYVSWLRIVDGTVPLIGL